MTQGHFIVWSDPDQGSSRPRLCGKAATGRRDSRLPDPVHLSAGGMATCGHHLGDAARPHVGAILIAGDLTDPREVVLELPRLTDQAQQTLRTRWLRAQAGDPAPHVSALGFARLHGHPALKVAHRGHAALLAPGSAAALHETLCDGTRRPHGLDGEDPALYHQSHVREDRERMRLIRHRRWPSGQPQAVPAPRALMGGGSAWLTTAPQGVPSAGQGFRLAWSRKQGREDTFRPRASGSFDQGAVQLASPMGQGGDTRRLVTGNAPGPYELLAVAAAPVGHRPVTAVATPPGHTPSRQHGGQGRPPAPWIAGIRDFMEAHDEGVVWPLPR
jgi:hypothetical protein